MDEKTILLVEDNPNDVVLTERALKKANVINKVVIVRDGVEALDYLFATGAWASRNVKDLPQVVLLDLKLPRIDGLEVLRRIKADPRTRLIPIVVLTSSREEQDVVEDPFVRSLTQGAPSGPTTTPCGAELVPSLICFTAPVLGSSRPSAPCPCAVYQTMPSAETATSCGREPAVTL